MWVSRKSPEAGRRVARLLVSVLLLTGSVTPGKQTPPEPVPPSVK